MRLGEAIRIAKIRLHNYPNGLASSQYAFETSVYEVFEKLKEYLLYIWRVGLS